MIINPLTKSQLLAAMRPGDRAIWYWKSIDPTVGARIEANVNAR